jgi:hypothetical protein
MVDAAEEYLPLEDAAKFVHRRYGKKKPHVNTLARWCIYGLQGRTLKSIKVGSKRMTTKEWIDRFFQAGGDQATAARQEESDRARQAADELSKQGI